MSAENTTPSGQQGFKDVIVTLPGWGLGLIAGLCLSSLLLALGLALLAPSDAIKGYALQLLVVLVPLGSAVIAGLAMRRTSTRQIDRLVSGFLEQTIVERLHIHCSTQSVLGVKEYPFNRVTLQTPSKGSSYAVYQLDFRHGEGSARAGCKCNVFNFEIFASVPLPDALMATVGEAPPLDANVLTAHNIQQIHAHPVLKHFPWVLKGSVNEGYEIHTDLHRTDTGWAMRFSMRQKLRENFLSSPFLKRYFAEDAAIVMGLLFQEWQAMQRLYAPQPEGAAA